jgi:hypothetical protein
MDVALMSTFAHAVAPTRSAIRELVLKTFRNIYETSSRGGCDHQVE